MENVNHVTIAGHLVKSAELRYTSTGKAVASFVVAANKKLSEDKQIVSYIPVNAWNQAEELGALVKGDAVLVTGELRTGSYEKNGRTIYTWHVQASNVMVAPFVNNKGNGNGNFDSFVNERRDEIPF